MLSPKSVWKIPLIFILVAFSGFQIAKLSIIPTVCVLEALINGKTYSSEVQASVVVVVLGVGICTITDVSVNAVGFITAAIAVLATSVQQIVSQQMARGYCLRYIKHAN